MAPGTVVFADVLSRDVRYKLQQQIADAVGVLGIDPLEAGWRSKPSPGGLTG
jgi:hypothetical protein